MITVQGVSKTLGKKDLFQGVSFHIHAGEKIGLIGHNGAGKTTLFHVLLKETEPDTGTVSHSKNLRMGYLPQQWVPREDKSVLAHAMDVHVELHQVQEELRSIQRALDREALPEEKDPERTNSLAVRQSQLLEAIEHMGGYDLEARAQKVLAGLGFRPEKITSPVSSLSGGWIMRLELARLLLSEPDLLLLDEPTNHLDLSSLLWLEQYLVNTPSAMLLISHDRTFLNTTVRRILELEGGRLQEYTGTYDDYLVQKAQRLETLQAAFRNQQDQIRQMERFIERNRVRASSARQAQSRLKALEKLERIELPDSDTATIHFSFPEPLRSGKCVLQLCGAKKSFGDLTLYEGLDLTIERGEHIALVGENGAGKTTLLKILAGVEPLSEGRRVEGHQTQVGYYAQYQWDQLHTGWTVLEEASSLAGDMSQTQIRGLLGAFLFRGEDVLKKVSVLSGGEKARLTLCKLLLQRPNVLLLDEPTNHLDIPSRDVLEQALRNYTGTICFISHDRHFINAIATRILLVKDGILHSFPGNYSDFENIWKSRLQVGEPTKEEEKTADTLQTGMPAPLGKTQERKRLEAEQRNQLYRLRKPLQEELEKVEKEAESAQKQVDELAAQLADPSTYQDGSLVQKIQLDYQRWRRRVQQATEQWETLALELEELEKNFREGAVKGG